MLRFLVGFVVIMHGLGHVAGVAASWSGADSGFSDSPWVFSRQVSRHSWLGRAWGVVWLAATAVLVVGGLGMMLLQPWWPSALLGGCVLWLAAILPWWNTVAPGARAGALLDLVLTVLLLRPWQAQVVSLLS